MGMLPVCHDGGSNTKGKLFNLSKKKKKIKGKLFNVMWILWCFHMDVMR